MKTHDLPIPEPCNADWNAMTGDEQQRFCSACQKHVTDISTYTKRDAETFLDANPSACVQYTKVGDEILFEPAARTSATFRRPRALLRRFVHVAAVAAVTSAPAVASSSMEDTGGTLVEWVASWFIEPVVVAPLPLVPELDEPITPRDTGLQVKGKVEPVVRTLRGRPVRRVRE